MSESLRGVMKLFRRKPKKLARADSDSEKVVQLIRMHGVRAVIDIGANVGQYARRMREAGLDLPIVSFEPGEEAHATLCDTAADDPAWFVAPCMAISDAQGTARLNVNRRSDMSSLKPMNDLAADVFPKAVPATSQEVRTERLDDVLAECLDGLVDDPLAPLFLKIDTQGSEAEIMRGAEHSIPRIRAIQMELSLVPLYEGESSYLQLMNLLDQLGYELHMIIPGYFSRTIGRQIQFDGIFVHRDR